MAANVVFAVAVFEKAWPLEGRVNVKAGSGSMGEELMSCALASAGRASLSERHQQRRKKREKKKGKKSCL